MVEENTQPVQHPLDNETEKNNTEELQKKCEEYLNNWKRSAADFVNYKKDEAERAGYLVKYAKEDIILNILPVIDSIELAEKQLPEDIKGNAWSEGFLQIKKQIEEFLKREGIEEIKTVGEKFNPEIMEAIGEAEAQGGNEGTVAQELQKGYKMGEKVIRPAKVRVTK